MQAPLETSAFNFRYEISKMMYGYGDSPHPNADTVIVIENVVLQQLRSLVRDAYQVSVERKKKNISNYDLLYVMHKNKRILKLKQLHDLQVKQAKFEQIKDIQLIRKLVADAGMVLTENVTPVTRPRKRTHVKVIRALSKIVTKVNHDYLGHLRKLRAKKVSESVPLDEYETYQEARCITFREKVLYVNDLIKFKGWIDRDRTYKITYSALEVLCFIACETVGDIVEAVLLCRQKNNGHNCSLAFNNGITVKWAISVSEVNEALSKYFTSNYWLNELFYKNIGLGYLTGLCK